MSSVGEAIKFFLNKNWVVFALSLIGGFFATIATPADWRNSIPFENNDWKTIAIFIVSAAIFYVIFSGIASLIKMTVKKNRNSKYRRENYEARLADQREDLKSFLTNSPDKFYWLVEHLVDNKNPWTYVYAGSGYEDDYLMNTEWFLIEDAPEKKSVKRSDGKVHQEIYMGRYKMKLHDQLYDELKAIKTETKSLSYRHRTKYSFEWEIADNKTKEKAK